MAKRGFLVDVLEPIQIKSHIAKKTDTKNNDSDICQNLELSARTHMFRNYQGRNRY